MKFSKTPKDLTVNVCYNDLEMFAGCPFEILERPKFVYDGKWLKMRELKFRKSDSSPEQVLHCFDLVDGKIYFVATSNILFNLCLASQFLFLK